MSSDPALDAGHFWLRVDQPLEYGKPFRIRAERKDGTVVIRTENVRRFQALLAWDPPATRCLVDGREFEAPPPPATLRFLSTPDGWRETGLLPAAEKSPARSGPFKRAFDRRFVLVVGTKGTEEENREMLELARYHAGTWWYRANGSAPVLRDADFLADPGAMAGRNLILYGNSDVNAAWGAAIPGSCPVAVRRGALAVGDRAWRGDGIGAVFVFPRAGPDGGLVGAFASTGPRGTRVGYGLLPFTSGVGYPDWAVYGDEFLRSGDGGVLAAGWFDCQWALQAGGYERNR